MLQFDRPSAKFITDKKAGIYRRQHVYRRLDFGGSCNSIQQNIIVQILIGDNRKQKKPSFNVSFLI